VTARHSPRPEVEHRLDALRRAVELADDRLDRGVVAGARDALTRADQRLARSAEAVVVALAGGTGSGKSSLFNALAGADLTEVGVRRPVTAEAAALVVGQPPGAGELLDWLGVRRRHRADPAADLPDGLVLLDLPDHDSIEAGHRRIVDRLVERVDVLVWVVDPMKYAQRALHAGYLRKLAAHAEVTLVVLNRVDELDPAARGTCLNDLRRLLDDEGLGGARVLATSAAGGLGVEALRGG
jgi:Fe2+ transport system protein B